MRQEGSDPVMRLLLKWSPILLVPVMFGLGGCTHGPSKEAVQKTINDSAAFSPAPIDLAISGSSIEAGVKLGCWSERYDGAISLTDKGSRIFSSCVGRIRGSRMIFFATPIKLIRRHVVEVTSISDPPQAANADGAKLVDFSWQWDLDGLPQDVRDCLALKTSPEVFGDGQAALIPDKDGWRVDKYADHIVPG
jgi:hypothetical protein